MSDLADDRKSAGYANKLGFTQATLAVLAPTDDDAILAILLGDARENLSARKWAYFSAVNSRSA
jgi:hypothetical protein